MNTTNTTPSELQSQEIVASQIAVGDLFLHSKGCDRVTEVSVTEDGATVIYWDGGRTMCEANAVLRIKPTAEATC